MPTYPGVRRVIQTGADQSGTQLRADASARKAQSILKARERINSVERTIENSDLAADDGVPPLAPANVQVEPYFHELIVSWDEPSPTDFVAFSIIRATPESEAPVEARGDPASGFVKNLANKPHSVIVKLIDRFGRESPWSDPITATPLLTAAETIDLGELAMLNRIRGLLPNANLQTITDATKLGIGVVGTDALGPGAVTGPKVATSAIATTHITDGAISTPKIQTGAVKTNEIDAGAVRTANLAAGSVTANEVASDAVITRHLRAGAVTADVMAAQDAAAFNLWAQNAMIRSAAIQSITADKITAGTMTAGQIAIAGGGSIKAGQVVFSSSGIEMPSLAQQSLAAQSRPSKISSLSQNAALYFMDTPQGQAAVVQGDASNSRPGSGVLAGINNPDDYTLPGNATMRAVSFTAATDTPSFIESHSRLFNVVALNYAYFRTPSLIIDGNLDVRGGLVCTRYCTSQRLSANGGGYRWGHNSNNSAILCQFQASSGGGIWRPIEFYNDLFVEEIDANTVLVRNNRGGAFDVRGWIFDVRQ